MDYRYMWGPRFAVPGLPVMSRKGESCTVIARGSMNSALVRWLDGECDVISRNALRRDPLTVENSVPQRSNMLGKYMENQA